MGPHEQRVHHVKGRARDVGFALGQMVGPRLECLITHYIQHGPGQHSRLDWGKLRRGALQWFRGLPERFQQEMKGLAEGSGVPLQRVAEWSFVEECVADGCSGFVCDVGGDLWVGRNNDIWVPDLWGYVTIREVEGRIPTMSFGMEGEPFTATGINRERLWLHYNWLPVWDTATAGKVAMLPFVFLTTALETCSTLEGVELLLSGVERRGGMMLFAVDGKSGLSAVYECTCCTYVKREMEGGWIAGTNHYCESGGQEGLDDATLSSQRRYGRVAQMLGELLAGRSLYSVHRSLMDILADRGVEQRGEDSGTVYANVACPGKETVWYTFGGSPAASAGAWARVEWPWEQESSR